MTDKKLSRLPDLSWKGYFQKNKSEDKTEEVSKKLRVPYKD